MKKTINLFVSILLYGIGFGINGCKKTPEKNLAPTISFVKITPVSSIEFQEKISITIGYDDVDGDLGQNDPAATNLWVTDSRNQAIANFRIQRLSPDDGKTYHLRGELTIEIPFVAIVGSTDTEAITYSIYMHDRAGNSSNTVTTSSITVRR